MRAAIFVILLLAMLSADGTSAREWFDSTGILIADAELVNSDETNAWLRKPSGEVVCLPMSRLSFLDCVFIRNRMGQMDQANEPGQPQEQNSLVDLKAKVEPAVVRINADDHIASGFVVDTSGLVLTNHHVVEGAGSATVWFSDRTSVAVTGYLGVDIGKDIVLLRIAPGPPRAALTLRGGLPPQGEPVAAFGFLGSSVSQGVVSAVRSGQEIQRSVPDLTSRAQNSHETTWIQTTATISSANSGGPLVDMNGEVVGINTQAQPVGQSLNFAVSCQDVSKLVSDSYGSPLESLGRLPTMTPATPDRRPPPSPPSSSEFPLVKLPSDASLSTATVEVPPNWPECNFTEETATRTVTFPNGEPKSVQSFLNARLHGPTLLLNETGEKRWAADYFEGQLHGSLWLWDEHSLIALFAQYVRGGKKGFVCLFDRGWPTLVQEWDRDQMVAESFIKWHGDVPMVFASDKLSDKADVEQLAAAKERLARLGEDQESEETEIKRDLADWFRERDREIKQQRVAAVNLRKRKGTLETLKARNAAEQAAFGKLWRRAATGR